MENSNDERGSPPPQLPTTLTAALPTDRFPETEEEADMVEVLLAKEFEQLTVQEREKILYDIHGVSDVIHEDPDEIERQLLELENELGKITEGNEAYTRAMALNQTYVTSSSFRLMFLRREKFDVKQAAQLIVRHFEVKRKLFGEGEVLARKVYLSDLGEQEITLLEAGFVDLWPVRDTAGRAILFLEQPDVLDTIEDFNIEYRVAWYVLMKALDDEETQRKGAVWIISFANENAVAITVPRYRGMKETQNAIPICVICKHSCYSNPEKRAYITGFQYLSPDDLRLRTRHQVGTPQEIMFKLQTFGIPTENFPWKKDLTIRDKERQVWLAQTRAHEELEMKQKRQGQELEITDGVVVPGRFDVLFGRSAFARGHTGTLRAMHIVQMNFESYEKLGRYQKMDMAEKIVKEIQASGGRFLRQEEDGQWVVVHDDEARKKVAHRFRRLRQDQLSKITQTGSPQTMKRPPMISPSNSPTLKRASLPPLHQAEIEEKASPPTKKPHDEPDALA